LIELDTVNTVVVTAKVSLWLLVKNTKEKKMFDIDNWIKAGKEVYREELEAEQSTDREFDFWETHDIEEKE
jgi:hypothetical protein